MRKKSKTKIISTTVDVNLSKAQTLILNYLPTTLNTYINAERGNKYVAAKIKKEETEKVAWECKAQKLKPVKGEVWLSFYWYVKNKRRDADNIAFSKKFIIDGLVKGGIIKNDNLKVVVGFNDEFIMDTINQVIIDIIPVKK